jgi:nicotinamide mononucleotide adenylyltransferase
MERTEQTTPTHVIASKLKQLSENDTKKTKVVLISTGSYNPVHIMHVETFKICKQQLEENHNMVVLGAFLSPSDDTYVQSKLGREFIHSTHRLNMCDLAVQEAKLQDWLIVDKWESSLGSFVDFPAVHGSLARYIAKQFPNDNIRVMYLCGTDHVLRCGGLYSLRKPSTGVVALRRPGSELKSDQNLFVLNNTVYETDFSSTEIRKRIKNGQGFDDLAHTSVVGYLQQNCREYLK